MKCKKELSPVLQLSQAYRIIHKFGGVKKLSAALAYIDKPRHWSTIYKWMYPKKVGGGGGTGGLIPTAAWPDVLKAAKYDGVLITIEDRDPKWTVKAPKKK